MKALWASPERQLSSFASTTVGKTSCITFEFGGKLSEEVRGVNDRLESTLKTDSDRGSISFLRFQGLWDLIDVESALEMLLLRNIIYMYLFLCRFERLDVVCLSKLKKRLRSRTCSAPLWRRSCEHEEKDSNLFICFPLGPPPNRHHHCRHYHRHYTTRVPWPARDSLRRGRRSNLFRVTRVTGLDDGSETSADTGARRREVSEDRKSNYSFCALQNKCTCVEKGTAKVPTSLSGTAVRARPCAAGWR
jgi:hypothetical protein